MMFLRITDHIAALPEPPMSDSKLAVPRISNRNRPPRTTRFNLVLLVLVAVFTFQLAPKLVSDPKTRLESDNSLKERTDDVRFDNYSLILKGQRIFLHSGEFHTWRLPVPSLWPDILEKTKAAGLNAISIYTHMGLINPSRGVIDFDGFRALRPLYEAAMAAGIWVVVRPGSYINAETSAGGIAHWVTAEVAGRLRTNDSDWTAAWQDYIQGIINETAPYQIHAGGPVIAIQLDNEYTQDVPGHGEYYEALKSVFHASDIVVPLTYNDPNPGANFINGTGAVDLYGMDSYPQRFDCSHPSVWRPVVTTYHEYHAKVNPSQPWYIPEFQAGSFDAWGPSAPGYAPCAELTGPDFQSVFNLQLWASNAKMINYYMLYGGTSWGAIPFPQVYTSYDYGAPISESRALTPKYDELKLQGLFLRSSPAFAKTDWVGDSRTSKRLAAASSNPDVFVTLVRNPDSGAAFYIVRQNDSTATGRVDFGLSVETRKGELLQLPLVASRITLGGRQSKAIVVDYTFGARSSVTYSTAAVFFAGVIDGRDVLFLHGPSDQAHEVALHLTGTPNPWFHSNRPHAHAHVRTSAHTAAGTVIAFLPGVEGLVTVYDSDTQLVLFADTRTAATFWVPALAGAAQDSFRNFWGVGTNASVLVGGPYLVRGAALEAGGKLLALRGDLREEVRLTVVVPRGVRAITWNGLDIGGGDLAEGDAGGSVRVFDLRPRAALASVRVPELSGWRYRDSLPEVREAFDDAEWVTADHTETNVPEKMWYGDGRILYGCDYGFCENIVLWRGHFNATGAETSVNLSINGGEAFAASIWLNDVFLNTSYGNSTNNMNIIEETDDKFTFPDGALKPGDNVITIIQDNMGLNETEGDDADTSKNPRGVRGFALDTGNFSDWKVQGKLGGYTGFPDKTRGVFNEGGLFGERRGWHLPGFDTSAWEARELSNGLPDGAAGVGFFVTTFDLDVEEFLDVHMSFTFEEPLGAAYRALLFVNGWMMGKRVANLGPQAKFPVPQGILDYQGENTVAVALWSMEAEAVSPTLRLVMDGVYDSALGKVSTDNPRWSSEGREMCTLNPTAGAALN
ncbi:glycoside hydrolase family 35 protein [Mycena metata]|uniref:beta-galactosidase n=1 Tax=Mycena metata TaxID=1033252 RepID=A0AAD7N0I8_9AGAR|nr:glycoside hydrolase family 35 protein [Mycena metata]